VTSKALPGASSRRRRAWKVRRLVIAGFGIGCLPEHVVAPDVAAGFVEAAAAGGIADVDIHLLWNREQRLSAESAFIEALQKA
jgi:DNA-binding transcriptional LysR family regulator